jgi:ribosome-binding protein aMBF1 (putative translation factor)
MVKSKKGTAYYLDKSQHGDIVRALRIKGITQSDLANKLNVNPSILSRMLKGNYPCNRHLRERIHAEIGIALSAREGKV